MGKRHVMKCSHCKEKAITKLSYVDRKLCRTHFVKMIEKRMRNAIREHSMIKKGHIVMIQAGEHSTALLFALKNLQKDLPFEIVKSKKNADKIGKSDSIDDLCGSVLAAMMNKKQDMLKFVDGKTIRPFLGIPKEELELYAKLNKCKIKKVKRRQNKIEKQVSKLLKTMVEKHPGTRFQIAKSLQKMENF